MGSCSPNGFYKIGKIGLSGQWSSVVEVEQTFPWGEIDLEYLGVQ